MSRSLHVISVAAVAALAAVALAACGSSSNNATVPSLGGGTRPQQSAYSGNLAAWRAAVACVRRHGMPGVPDPVVGPDGQITVPGYTSTAQLTPAARSACAPELRAESSGSTHPLDTASEIQALLRYAACARTHGLPHWPDPNQRGEFHVKSADAGTLVQSKQASSACDSLLPPDGVHFIVTPSGQ